MSERLYSVGEVAEQLGLHVRTVRSYVREGRLAAVRIGKQYRVRQSDLEEFTGGPATATGSGREPDGGQWSADVSSIVDVDGIDPGTADRVSTLLTAMARSRGPGEEKVRVEIAYDRERERMKIIVLGGLADTAHMLDYVQGVLES
ncbi:MULTISPECIES: helix-turn-helix domain-containing protein [unclassified Streptomyces]|uniref:helix-turn-helix domain-containing protein n=1 Tax=unclassified Streptomyces TaxID=2593676 RepID=UPI000CD50BE2|nr:MULTISPECIES: helix-turn-helix domain-containing protein [unclassified Streptomyces]